MKDVVFAVTIFHSLAAVALFSVMVATVVHLVSTPFARADHAFIKQVMHGMTESLAAPLETSGVAGDITGHPAVIW